MCYGGKTPLLAPDATESEVLSESLNVVRLPAALKLIHYYCYKAALMLLWASGNFEANLQRWLIKSVS